MSSKKLTKPSLLTKNHNADLFDCGDPTLNTWIKGAALKAAATQTATTFVVCRGRTVVGYYSLATAAVAHQTGNGKKVVGAARRNTPDPIPALLLARLAVDKREQNSGIGKGLLLNAFRRTQLVMRHVGVRLMIVHPLNGDARRFYQKYGFAELNDGQGAMYLKTANLV